MSELQQLLSRGWEWANGTGHSIVDQGVTAGGHVGSVWQEAPFILGVFGFALLATFLITFWRRRLVALRVVGANLSEAQASKQADADKIMQLEAALDNEKDQARKQRDSDQEANEHLRNERDLAEDRCRELSNDLKKSQEEVQQEREFCRENERLLEQERGEAETQNLQLGASERRVEQLQEEERGLKAQIERIKEDYSAAVAQRNALRVERDRLQMEFDASKSRVWRLNSEINESKGEIARIDKERSAAVTERDALKTSQGNLQNENEDLKDQNAELLEQNTDLESRLALIPDNWLALKEELETRVQVLLANIQDQQGQLDEADAHQKQWATAKTELEQRIVELETRLAQVEPPKIDEILNDVEGVIQGVLGELGEDLKRHFETGNYSWTCLDLGPIMDRVFEEQQSRDAQSSDETPPSS